MTWLYFMYKALGTFITPPGIFIAAAFCGALFFLYKKFADRTRRFGASVFLFILAFSLYFFSIPWSVKALLSPLEDPFTFEIPSPQGKNVVLVLSGGIWTTGEDFHMSAETLQRFFAGVRAATTLGCPLLFSGGFPGRATERQIYEMVVRTAGGMKFSGPLLVEGTSRTTWENMKFSALYLKELGAENIVLVTSAYHMKRSIFFAERFFKGCHIHPYPSGRLSELGKTSAMDFLPSPASFQYFSSAIRELVGLAVYRLLPEQFE
ncbi:MAG: YdcF family protein [Verrucomicrobiae bacterium]|nr:YdcF family protein [Verrucomicrobiae bacterium]